MTGASIGSVSFLPSQGRLGVVVGARTVGAPGNGHQLVAIQIRAVGPSKCEDCGDSAPLSTAPGNPAGGSGRGAASAAQNLQSSSNGADRGRSESGAGPQPGARSYENLDPEERAVVDRLRQRDAQVKQEEKAHAAVAGDLAGPISYVYQRGPDGQLYAVGGSVPLQAQTISADSDEAARIGARIAAAGQAATNPSGADLAAVRAGYRLQGQDAQDARPAGRELDVTA